MIAYTDVQMFNAKNTTKIFKKKKIRVDRNKNCITQMKTMEGGNLKHALVLLVCGRDVGVGGGWWEWGQEGLGGGRGLHLGQSLARGGAAAAAPSLESCAGSR